MLANLIRLAFLLPMVPTMFALSLLSENAVPTSFVDALDAAWSNLFPEE